MSPPIPRPFPCFLADSPQEGRPYGRWAERLTEEFAKACEPHAGEAGAPLNPEAIKWFPERGWGGRVFVPVTGRATEPIPSGEPKEGEQASGPALVEYFGHVSFAPRGRRTGRIRATADFTDVGRGQPAVEDRPLGRRTAPARRGSSGEITLVWGLRWWGRRRRHRGARWRGSTRRPSRTAGSRWSPSMRCAASAATSTWRCASGPHPRQIASRASRRGRLIDSVSAMEPGEGSSSPSTTVAVPEQVVRDRR